MRVLFLTLANSNIASSRVRVFQHLPYLNKAVKTKVIVRNPYYPFRSKNTAVRIFQGVHIQVNMLYFLWCALFYKNIFIQKIFVPERLIKLMVRLHRNVIYDFDDAIFINEKNEKIKEKRLKRLKFTLQKASTVIVTNEPNRNFALQCGSHNVHVITGPIECNRFKPRTEHTGNTIVIGWIGSPGTTKYLELIARPLQTICARHANVSVMLIGASAFQPEGVAIESHPWLYDTEVGLLKKFDIGLMPLHNDAWSEGKGAYKLLQYMACGIPSVVSAVGVNADIAAMGNVTLLAQHENEWIEQLEVLITNSALRQKMGETARNVASEHFSYERYSSVLSNCFV